MENHFDINTNENGIPATKNNKITKSILYILLLRRQISAFLTSEILIDVCILYKIAKKLTFNIVADVIEKIIPFTTSLLLKHGMQNDKNEV